MPILYHSAVCKTNDLHRSTSLLLCECGYYLFALHIHFLPDISYRSHAHVLWRREHEDIEASADIGPYIFYEEDTVSSSSSR